MIPQKIYENQKVQSYLKVQNLEKQYLKATQKLLDGDVKSVNFKTRRPKSDGVFQFRINKQFRAIGYFDNHILKISKIDNHQ